MKFKPPKISKSGSGEIFNECPLYLSTYLFIFYLSIDIPVYLYTSLSIYISIYVHNLHLLLYYPTNASVHLSTSLLIPLPLLFPTHLSVHLPTSLFLSLPPFSFPALASSALESHYFLISFSVRSYIPRLCLRSHLGIAAVCQGSEHTSGRPRAYPSNFNWFLSDLLLNAFACVFVCLWGVCLVVDSCCCWSFACFDFFVISFGALVCGLYVSMLIRVYEFIIRYFVYDTLRSHDDS